MFKHYFSELNITIDDYLELFVAMNEEQRNEAFLLFDQKQPIGFIMFTSERSSHWFIEERFGFIREFWVDPNYRKTGHGSTLLTRCEQHFIDNGIYRILLTTNTAQRFYIKHGYKHDENYTAKNEDDVFVKDLQSLIIKISDENDLDKIKTLWNDGDVMHFVGFPKGLGTNDQQMKSWLTRINNDEKTRHYSIYNNGIFCGETFYSVDEYGYAAMDIKLFPHAQKKGIAFRSLSQAIDDAFTIGKATFVYVDPHPDNVPALALYKKLRFIPTEKPTHLDVADTYSHIQKEDWLK